MFFTATTVTCSMVCSVFARSFWWVGFEVHRVNRCVWPDVLCYWPACFWYRGSSPWRGHTVPAAPGLIPALVGGYVLPLHLVRNPTAPPELLYSTTSAT